ncbi:DNA polymerase ligase N-terminal domain-containing protein [Flindersiella endophytica]
MAKHKQGDLTDYKHKRDFRRTGEPKGTGSRGREHKQPRFVVQRHDASSLHFDFRLEVDGVLKSWAIPKGPSPDPREKRLATPTEDHPMDYAGYEGVIPEGEYGAGSVIVWDTGTYENLSEHKGDELPVDDALEQGHVKVRLHGEKLHGAYALTRFREERGKAQWLLVKVDDEGANRKDKPTVSRPESALTGRTNEDVAEEES